MEHLALEIFDLKGSGSKFARLPESTSITITDTSEIFASGDMWTHAFTLNVKANAHIFGTTGELHGDRLHDQLDRRKARLWVEGVALYLGYLRLDDEVEVDGNGDIDVNFESGMKTFSEMIEGAKANQVPMMNDVRIGMALWRKRWTSIKIGVKAHAKFTDGSVSESSDVFFGVRPHSGTMGTTPKVVADGEEEGSAVQEYPRMVFPKGEFVNMESGETETIDCINTDHPYTESSDGTPAYPYCNTALCYQKYGYDRKQEDGSTVTDYSSEPEAQRGYELMPANRLNSAPNFYVIYWIRSLMHHLGIDVRENQMMGIEDLRRLFFVNTKCAYLEPLKLRTVATDPKMGKYKFPTPAGSSARKRLVPEYFGTKKEVGSAGGVKVYDYDHRPFIDVEHSHIKCTDYTQSEPHVDHGIGGGGLQPDEIPVIESIVTDIVMKDNGSVKRGWWNAQDLQQYENNNGYLHNAIASNECFPNVDISDVIKAIENGFGVRFLFSEDYKRVRIVLLKEIFRNKEVQEINSDIISITKQENCIRGFRLTYGGGEDNTSFYYKGFADKLPHKKPQFEDDSDKHDYSHWQLDALYGDVINKVSAFDKTCYVTPLTGNAYGIKIDKDAKRYDELHPSLFEYAAFMDAEDGDCSGEESTIETIEMGFTPAIMNDINAEAEREGGNSKQQFALFVEEQMRPRRPDMDNDNTDGNEPDKDYDVYAMYDWADGMKAGDGIVQPGIFSISSDMTANFSGAIETKIRTKVKVMRLNSGANPGARGETFVVDWDITGMKLTGHINEAYRLYLQDNFEPNDTGVSPIETHDWGLTLGIMRGSGSDAGIDYAPDNDDLEGNETWETHAGSNVTVHPDTCDNYGNEFDYNGSQEGIGADGRISLKLRAEKPNPYFDPKKPEGPDNLRYLEIEDTRLRGRGLADKLYKDYSYFIRNARIAKLTTNMTLAQLRSIDKTKRVKFGDLTGFIRKTQYSVDIESGLGSVTFELLYI